MHERVPGHVIVFGGTFDPVHNGHLAIARQALQATGADALWFLPAGSPYLHAQPVASAEDRLALLHAAVDGMPGFAVRDDELRRPSTSYTVDTVRELHREQPETMFSLLLGADAARSIRRWHLPEELQSRERFLIVNRHGTATLGREEAAALGFDPARTTLIEVSSPDISASEVRARADRGQALSGLVPARVEKLITRRGLYARRPSHA
jgi:nicotinate-nucleotide adenylyltransferase